MMGYHCRVIREFICLVFELLSDCDVGQGKIWHTVSIGEGNRSVWNSSLSESVLNESAQHKEGWCWWGWPSRYKSTLVFSFLSNIINSLRVVLFIWSWWKREACDFQRKTSFIRRDYLLNRILRFSYWKLR